MDEIISIIYELDEFNDFVYEQLVIRFGKKDVDEAIFKLLSDEDINSKIFKKLVRHSDNKCTLVINRDYTIVLSNIVKQLNDMFISIGFDESLLTKEMHYKMAMFNKDFISKNSVSREIIEQINNLYKRFIQIRNKIVDANIELIINYNKKFDTLDDSEGMCQEITIALMNACEEYDPSRGRFVPFAYIQMYNTLWKHMHDSKSYIYLPNYVYCHYAVYVNFITKYYEKHGYYPCKGDIILHTGLSLTDIEKLQEIYNYNNRDMSIESMVLVDGEYMPLMDSFYDNRNVDSVEDIIIEDEFKNSLMEIINELPENDKKVIIDYYFNDCSLASLGREMHFTRAGVSSIHREALKKMRRKITLREKMER